MSNPSPKITYDLGRQLAMFDGPGGFTQFSMPENNARAIAIALSVPFKVAVPGVDVRRSAIHPDSFNYGL